MKLNRLKTKNFVFILLKGKYPGSDILLVCPFACKFDTAIFEVIMTNCSHSKGRRKGRSSCGNCVYHHKDKPRCTIRILKKKN